MPKSQKQKKAKAADFTKARLKVGKGKQIASNATNTNYSSKTIGLGKQNIGADKGDEPVTRRNQTLDDLLVLTKHYNAGTRKDALLGLKEIINAHAGLYKAHLGGIIHNTARLIADDDASVRKALLAFYTWFLPLVPKDVLGPFLSTVLFFTTSALANIFPEVRRDAVPIVDLILSISPETVTAGALDGDGGSSSSSASAGGGSHGQRILTAYLSLLAAGGGSGSSDLAAASTFQLSPPSKVLVLKSLATFIVAATSGGSADDERPSVPVWFLPPAFSSRAALDAFLGLLPSTSTASSSIGRKGEPFWTVDTRLIDLSSTHRHLYEPYHLARHAFEAPMVPSLPSTTEELQRMLAFGTAGQIQVAEARATPTTAAGLLRLLQPLLLSTFLDTAPSAFAPASLATASTIGPDVHLETVWCVGRITRDLWRATAVSRNGQALEKADLKKLGTLLEKMGAYFVFGEDELRKRDTQSLAMLQDLNLIYSELVALLALSHGGAMVSNKVAAQLERVAQYVVAVLKGEVTSASQPVASLLTPASYAALLPTVWSLLSRSFAPAADASAFKGPVVFDALLDHFASLGAGSESKALGFVFVARTCLMEDMPGCKSPVDLSALPASSQQKLLAWFRSLPKYLWELGSKNLEATAAVLAFLHRAASRPLLRFAEELPALAPLLVPYFHVTRPQSSFVGPYGRLPPHLKTVARGLAAYVAEEAEEAGAPLLEAVAKAQA